MVVKNFLRHDKGHRWRVSVIPGHACDRFAKDRSSCTAREPERRSRDITRFYGNIGSATRVD